ncbi:MAG TPA: UvrD-helicase domain-containing protein [Ktedonobacteraceae bacterium]|nr:UvrD-helicase domain-containing protein [Ktedonobacteraceae bacterium]
MKTQWQPLIKPALLQDITRLPAKELHQVMEKIALLTEDPRPDNKAKKQLMHYPGKPFRIRSGDYRIFYTYNQRYVSIYRIERRNETIYKARPEDEDGLDEDMLPDDLEGVNSDASAESARQPDWERSFAQAESRPLPMPITQGLLNSLGIPKAYHQRLLQIRDEDGLLGCSGVKDDVLIQLHDYMFERPLLQVMQQPDLVLSEVDDLLRYKEGELLAFLLRLSPEQERYVNWPLNASGPTLVKGGPGTGKSTVALYRIRSLLQQWSKTSHEAPRILFTTYTNALIKSSEQLLQQLLGPDAQYVTVQTADKLAHDILYRSDQPKEIVGPDELHRILQQAIKETPLEGNLLQCEAQRQTLEKMGGEYLLQEIISVIVARQTRSLADYLSIARTGRKLRLNATQRKLIWKIYERWHALMLATGKETWQQRRARAELLVKHCPLYTSYDAVVIDEAQDLDPSSLRMLLQLCKAPNRIFVTADANQSIYGSGFTWSDVHQSLKFQGRTSILHANYRSTREIGEAAQSYLTAGALEPEIIERHYINNGPMPDVRSVQSSHHEAQLLASFFRKAMRSLSLALGSCAVLCPSERSGKNIAAALVELGLQATYMSGQDLNLSHPGIKVLTLNTSKGLEFPIVALAGFIVGNYPIIPYNASAEERSEILFQARRTMFVGMTRAMRALLIIVPTQIDTPLLKGFDQNYWNLTRKGGL